MTIQEKNEFISAYMKETKVSNYHIDWNALMVVFTHLLKNTHYHRFDLHTPYGRSPVLSIYSSRGYSVGDSLGDVPLQDRFYDSIIKAIKQL